jgi:hypothetical protein
MYRLGRRRHAAARLQGDTKCLESLLVSMDPIIRLALSNGRLSRLRCSMLRSPSLPFTRSRQAVSGFPAKELIEASKDADFVVVGSRGVGGFAKLMTGSTSSQVAEHAHCPVVVVPGER